MIEYCLSFSNVIQVNLLTKFTHSFQRVLNQKSLINEKYVTFEKLK